MPVRGVLSPSVSPDGSRVVFTALGDLWLMRIGGQPERLTDDPWVEVDPAWSAGGRNLAGRIQDIGEVGLRGSDRTGPDRR